MNEKKKALAYFQKAAIAAKDDENSRLSFLIYHHWGSYFKTKHPTKKEYKNLKKRWEMRNLEKIPQILFIH